jgi:hypothetical protein
MWDYFPVPISIKVNYINYISFSAKGNPVILLLLNAGPLDISFAKGNAGVNVIIECFFPAQATGEALHRVFYNNGPGANPAGRLPLTWPAVPLQVCKQIKNYLLGTIMSWLLDLLYCTSVKN